MASGKTNTHENEVINHYVRNQASSGPYTGYLALFSVAPGEASAGTELSGNGYARIALGAGAPSDGVASNASTITFTAAGGAWSQIVGHAIMTASSGGTAMYYEDSVSGPTLGDGDSYEFDPGDAVVSET